MGTQRSEVRTRAEIEAAWRELLRVTALARPSRKKYRGREIVGNGFTSTPGRLGRATRGSVDRFLDNRDLYKAKRAAESEG